MNEHKAKIQQQQLELMDVEVWVYSWQIANVHEWVNVCIFVSLYEKKIFYAYFL